MVLAKYLLFMCYSHSVPLFCLSGYVHFSRTNPLELAIPPPFAGTALKNYCLIIEKKQTCVMI
jgi:hypothetical protein